MPTPHTHSQSPSAITPGHGHGGLNGSNGNGRSGSSEAGFPAHRAGSVGAHGDDSGAGQSPRVRVILVGRTGHDAALRLDQSVELLRAHHPLGAIGELASPMDASSPRLATVIVSGEVLPDERARSFVASLRRVEPSVRVLLISKDHRPEFDGTIPPEITPDALRRLVHSVHGPVTGPALGLDEDDALAIGPKTDEDEVLDVLLGGKGSSDAVSDVATGSDRFATDPDDSGGIGLERDEPSQAAEVAGAGSAELAAEAGEESAEAPAAFSMLKAHHQEPLPVEIAEARTEPAQAAAGARTVFADSRVLEALLSGVESHEAVVSALRQTSNVGDLELIVHDDLAEPEEVKGPPDAPHIKLVHTGLVMGYLWSPSGQHLGAVTPEQAQWSSLCLALARKQRQLGEYAFTDELTGAFNRRFFNQFMGEALNRAKALRQFLTLLYFDIDDFKLYNDRFGHDSGDDILLQTVSLLKSVIRPSDKVCRLGGDEFAVIFYDPAAGSSRSASGEAPMSDARVGGAPQSIGEIAKRFQKQICEHRYPKLAENAPGTLTISGGMATFPWDGRNAEELLRRADELLLQSKAQGKNLITLGPGAQQVCELGERE